MVYALPVTKQEYIAMLNKEPEVGERKIKNKYRELTAYVRTLSSDPHKFGENLYCFLHEHTPKCGMEGCTKIPKFGNWREGYKPYCSYSCSIRAQPRGAYDSAYVRQRMDTAKAKKEAFWADINARIAAGSERCECGAVARFYCDQKDTWRCLPRKQSCPTTQERMGEAISLATKGVAKGSWAMAITPREGVLCEYGCGRLACYEVGGGTKLSCSDSHHGCEAFRVYRGNLMKVKYKDPAVKAQFLARMNATHQANHGVDWANDIPGIKEKRARLMEERWGPGITHKNLIPHLREQNERMLANTITVATKDYQWPSGKISKVRGFEDLALDDLLTLFDETEILIGFDQVPKITYSYGGKNRKYYPDIFIPSINTIVEVKGTFTYTDSTRHKDGYIKNKLKEKATVAAGYKFMWFVYLDRQSHYLLSLAELAELDASLATLTE
jgi:hypothetical protein